MRKKAIKTILLESHLSNVREENFSKVCKKAGIPMVFSTLFGIRSVPFFKHLHEHRWLRAASEKRAVVNSLCAKSTDDNVSVPQIHSKPSPPLGCRISALFFQSIRGIWESLECPRSSSIYTQKEGHPWLSPPPPLNFLKAGSEIIKFDE